CLLREIRQETETLAERFSPDADDPAAGDRWDYAAGSEKSKCFGLFTFCQMGEEEMRDFLGGDRMQLAQIGEDFTGFGVLNVAIRPDDLARRHFSDCEVLWSMS